jgi:hypothetical protein
MLKAEITVPSFSYILLPVRAGCEFVISSTKSYRSAILPSSAFQPWERNPCVPGRSEVAKSKLARSTPLRSPDMIFRSIFENLVASPLRFWGLLVDPLFGIFPDRELGKSPQRELFTNGGGNEMSEALRSGQILESERELL